MWLKEDLTTFKSESKSKFSPINSEEVCSEKYKTTKLSNFIIPQKNLSDDCLKKVKIGTDEVCIISKAKQGILNEELPINASLKKLKGSNERNFDKQPSFDRISESPNENTSESHQLSKSESISCSQLQIHEKQAKTFKISSEQSFLEQINSAASLIKDNAEIVISLEKLQEYKQNIELLIEHKRNMRNNEKVMIIKRSNIADSQQNSQINQECELDSDACDEFSGQNSNHINEVNRNIQDRPRYPHNNPCSMEIKPN